jgi:peptide/nickel transport system substrate-binding protein
VPGLAESWEIGADGRTWTFHLREGATFAGGNPVTADAVVFSLRRMLTIAGNPSWLLTQFGITGESISAVDDRTVQIVLDQQYAPGMFLSCLAGLIGAVLDPDAVTAHEQDGDLGSAWLEDHSAGSGPYVLAQRNRDAAPVEYTFTANDAYWGDPPVVKEIRVQAVQEPLEQVALLKQGAIDIAWNLQPDLVPQLKGDPQMQIAETLTLSIMHAGMNVAYEPLAKPEVRDAIRYAIDYEGMLNYVLGGAALKIQTVIPKGFLGHNPATPYQYDVSTARQLLAQAGYADGFDLELKTLDFAPWTDLALRFKADLAHIGVRVTITHLTADQLIEALFSRNFQMYVWEILSDYFDPDSNAKMFAHCDSLGDDATIKAAAWTCSYLTPETSKLVEQAAQEFEREQRNTLYQQITDIILDDGPFVVLYTPVKQYGLRSEIVGLVDRYPVTLHDFPGVK